MKKVISQLIFCSLIFITFSCKKNGIQNQGLDLEYQTNSIPSTGLIAYWPFDGNGNDVSGNGHNATLTNVTSTTDRFGNPNGAYDFNGYSSFASVADQTALKLNGSDFTLNAWVKLDSYNSSYGSIIIGKRIPGNNNGYIWSVTGSLSSPAGVLSFGPGGSSSNAFGTSTIGLNGWHMVTSVYHYSSGSLDIYIDGKFDNSTSGILSPNGAITASLYIGKDGSNTSYLDGALDDIRMYSRALSSNEIQNFYNSSSVPSKTGLIAYWPFDGNGNDVSGNGHNATLTNVTSTTDRLGNPNGAYDFNGYSSFASVADQTALRLNGSDFTLNAWVKLDSYNSSYGSIIIGKRIPGNNNGYIWSVTGSLSSPAGVLSFGPGGSSSNAFGTSTIGLNGWHMVTSVYHYSSGSLDIYIDGNFDNSTSGILSPNGAITASLYIGKDGSNTSYLDGALDDIRMYSRALSSNEIQNLYSTIY